MSKQKAKSTSPSQDISSLKIRNYDLIVKREALQREIQRLSQEIAQIAQLIAEKEKASQQSG